MSSVGIIGSGAQSKSRHLNQKIMRIKPKGCRVVVRPPSYFTKRGASKDDAVTIDSVKGFNTINISPFTDEASIVHEFGHVASGHQSGYMATGTLLQHELEAWKWAEEHWDAPKGKEWDRKRWIFESIAQIVEVYGVGKNDGIKSAKSQMAKLGMAPMTSSEEHWIRNEMRDIEVASQEQVKEEDEKNRKAIEGMRK